MEIRDSVTTACRKSIRCKALWKHNTKFLDHRVHFYVDFVIFYHLQQTVQTCKKNSCRIISSKLGRSSGFFDNILAIKCFAGAKRDEGRLYLASLIHLYVSLRFVVSNGGLPNSIVYLFEGKGKRFYFTHPPYLCLQLQKKALSISQHEEFLH